MRSNQVIKLLDTYYANQLGCTVDDLNGDQPKVVVNPRLPEIKFAKDYPLAIYSLTKGNAPVISVRPPLDRIIRSLGEYEYQDLVSGKIQRIVKLTSVIKMLFWFQGIRLYCCSESFVNKKTGEVREVSNEDERAVKLHAKWGGPVFGQIVDGKAVSLAAVKTLSDICWDLRVETQIEYQRKGYAKSVVSAAVRHILDCGKIAGWGTDNSNTASLRTAKSVGFLDYALDFGCVEERNRL